MLNPEMFCAELQRHHISFFCGVPDSLLKYFCYVLQKKESECRCIVTANEGNAVALAAGHFIASGEIPCVFMQNSGLGNAVNPLLSLADPEVYSIPMLIVAVFYCQYIGKKIYQVPTADGKFERKDFRPEYIKSMEELDRLIGEKELPGLWASIAPIIVPLILILMNTVLSLLGIEIPVIAFIGEPVIALAAGTLIAVYGLMAKADTWNGLKRSCFQSIRMWTVSLP